VFEETQRTHRIHTKYLKYTRDQSKQDILNRDSIIFESRSPTRIIDRPKMGLISWSETWNRGGRWFTSSRGRRYRLHFEYSLPVLKIYSARHVYYRFSVLAVNIETQPSNATIVCANVKVDIEELRKRRWGTGGRFLVSSCCLPVNANSDRHGARELCESSGVALPRLAMHTGSGHASINNNGRAAYRLLTWRRGLRVARACVRDVIGCQPDSRWLIVTEVPRVASINLRLTCHATPLCYHE